MYTIKGDFRKGFAANNNTFGVKSVEMVSYFFPVQTTLPTVVVRML